MTACFRNKKYDFDGKVALITGSSAGIGAAIAYQFAEYGANVVITGRNLEELTRIAQKIMKKTDREPLVIVGDLQTDQQLPSKLIDETVKKFGRLDILVNNAGTGIADDTFDNPDLIAEFDKMFELNVRVPLRLCRLAVEHLEKTHGNIINISSNASAEPILFTYSMSKAALDMLTKGAAQDLGSKGIRVNSINPGPTITSMGRCLGKDVDHFEKSKDKFAKFTILNRIPYPEEMANLASFLASNDGANITGAIIVSDGGMLVKKRQYFAE
ncbi:Enoyl-(Acyl carrier protein) reductase-like protein [Euroglyphus maynei]|uniref:Enoyl-(Acyl carrier protein) reductase-like protein n=1 Tax=Euroglyphus maynei TaxID=6958 RepID=A0A1Y3BC26_EURMA|nr:Enoyl-(Acyl carrier protein) reductase-like protein [Euroglyphus maynei]